MPLNKLVIYTSIFGNYDRLIDPVVYSKDIDYVCFTNSSNFVSDIWQIKIVKPRFHWDMIRSARLLKICPHRFLSQYQYSLYIDGNMRLNRIPDIVTLLDGQKLAMEQHRKRKCLYVEAEVCKERKLDHKIIIDGQINFYRTIGFPENAGLYASYMIAREHNDGELMTLNEAWWRNVRIYSRRDQISLPVVFDGYPIKNISSRKRGKMTTIKRHFYGK